jgi:hypothetical protein
VTRRFTRITALALTIAATAVPAAHAYPAQDRVSPDARDAGTAVVIDKVSPDARDAGRPVVVDRVSPDARDNGRREPAPIVVSEPVTASDRFDWLDAGVGAAGFALLLTAYGAAMLVRTRRHTAGV